MLKVNHQFGKNISIEFKHTNNYTVLEITPMMNKNKQLEGHYVTIRIHPQKALLMKDYITIQFIQSQSQSNESNESKTDDQLVKHNMIIRIDAKVLFEDEFVL